MNYADEATRFLDLANEAERGAIWRSEELSGKAHRDAQKYSPVTVNPDEGIVLLAHDRLKENDREYQKHVSDNKFFRAKAQVNALLALVHGHTPTIARSQA